jgi:hypothetical protein
MIETLTTLASENLAPMLFKTVWEGGEKVLGATVGKVVNKAQFSGAVGKYAENYEKRHGTLKVLGMPQPVSLEQVYTQVQLIPEREIYRFASVTELEKSFRESKRRFGRGECKTEKGIIIANQQQFLMVLGAPGSGKSTFLRRIGLEAFKRKKGEYEHECLPVFLELKRFTSGSVNVIEIIAEEFEVCGFPEAQQFTEKALEKGKLLVIFDGLDEVPTRNLNAVVGQIQDFVDRYDNNRFIASCRTAAYRSSFQRFQDVEIADFSHEQIEQFISNWFSTEVDREAQTGQKCWELLQKDEYAAAKELAKTPLLLTFLCVVYDESQTFPNHRSRLYHKALRILLEKWAAEKRLERDPIYEGLHIELEEILLTEIADQGFQQDQLFFDKREIVQQIKNFLAENLNAPQHLNGEAVLDAMAVQQGILVERAEDIYSFSHLTLQEYLTAQHIVDNHQVQEIVEQHLIDPRWKEVFLLIAGLMRGGADDLLLAMEAQALKYLETPTGQKYLIPWFKWAEEITTGSIGDLEPVAKRWIAVANVIAIIFANALAQANISAFSLAKTFGTLNVTAYNITINHSHTETGSLTKTYAYALSRAFEFALANPIANATKFFIEYVQALKQLPEVFQEVELNILIKNLEQIETLIPDESAPSAVHQRFDLSFLLDAFCLKPEMVKLSEAEVKEIDREFFYIYKLMLQCKDAAVRVSPTTWAEIEERMLRVPNGIA